MRLHSAKVKFQYGPDHAPIWFSLPAWGHPDELRPLFRRACERKRSIVWAYPHKYTLNFALQLRDSRDEGEILAEEPAGEFNWNYVITLEPQQGKPLIRINGENQYFHRYIGFFQRKRMPKLKERSGIKKKGRGRPTGISKKLRAFYTTQPDYIDKETDSPVYLNREPIKSKARRIP